MNKNGVVIPITNVKGGVGKTSLTNALAHEFANLGKKVLVIDLDPQASQTTLFNIDPNDVVDGEFQEYSVYNVYKDKRVKPLPVKENIDLLPASKALQDDVENSHQIGNELKLKLYLRKIKARANYDYILVDPPSNSGVLTMSAIFASDYILIPQRLTLLDETGTVDLIETLETQALLRDSKFKILGLIPAFYEKRNKLFQEKIIKLKDEINQARDNLEGIEIINDNIFFSPIRKLNVWTKAQEERVSLRDYILNRDRTYKSVLEELKLLIDEIEENIKKDKVKKMN